MQIPHANSVDFACWARQPFWTADQATALSYGRNPETFWDDDMIKYSANWGCFVQRRDSLRQALSNTMRPTDWLAWGKLNGVPFPESLELEVFKHEHDIFDRLEELETKLGAKQAEIEKLKADLGAKQAEIEGLRANARAKEPTVDDLKPKELTSVYSLIYGMARIHYGYDPRRHVSPAKKIQGQLKDKAGVTIDDDATVLKQLRKAAEHLDAAALLDEQERQAQVEERA